MSRRALRSQSAVEYVVLVGGVAMVALPAIQGLQGALNAALDRTTRVLAGGGIHAPSTESWATKGAELAPAHTLPAGALPSGAAPSGAAPSGVTHTDAALAGVSGVTAPPTGSAPATGAAAPHASEVHQLATQPLTLLSAPGGAALGALPAGAEVRVLEAGEDHWRVQLPDGGSGWVAKADLPLPAPPVGSIRLGFTDHQPGISHYQIHYGTQPGVYDQWVRLDAESRLTLLAGLEPGVRYYMVLKAVDHQGRVSGPSGEVSKIAELPPQG